MRTGGRGARRSNPSSSPPPGRAGQRAKAGEATPAAGRGRRAVPASASRPSSGRGGAARACPGFAAVRRASTRGVRPASVLAPPPPSVRCHTLLTFRSVRMLRPSASARRRQSPLLREIPPRSSLLVLDGSLQCLVRSGTGRPRVRSLAFVQEIAMSGSDDERTITRIVKVWRVLGLVATHANARVHVGIDVTGRIGGVLGARPVTHLTLDVLPSLTAALEAAAACSGAVDAADAARLLPPRHVTSHAVEAELLLLLDQRVVGVGMPRVGPELGLRLVAGGASLHLARGRHSGERGFAGQRFRARLGLLLRQLEVHLRDAFVVVPDELLRERVLAGGLGERQERRSHDENAFGSLLLRRGDLGTALLQVVDLLRVELVHLLRGVLLLLFRANDALVELLQLLLLPGRALRQVDALRGSRRELEIDTKQIL